MRMSICIRCAPSSKIMCAALNQNLPLQADFRQSGNLQPDGIPCKKASHPPVDVLHRQLFCTTLHFYLQNYVLPAPSAVRCSSCRVRACNICSLPHFFTFSALFHLPCLSLDFLPPCMVKLHRVIGILADVRPIGVFADAPIAPAAPPPLPSPFSPSQIS